MILRCLFFMFLLAFGAFGQTARIDQAQKLYEAKKYAESTILLEAVKEGDKDYAAAQYYLGRIAFDKKEFDHAEDYFEEAVDANDKVADYHNWLGNTYGQIASDANIIKQGVLAPKMKNAWERAVALNPSMIEPRLSLIQYYMQAPGFMGGSVDKAKETATQITKLDPARGHMQMGNIYVKEKKIPEAETEYKEMVKANPDYVSVLANFYANQKQFDKAFAIFDEALKKDPEDMIAIYQIGKTCAISGQKLDRGEECLKKYLAYPPKQNEPSHAGANMRLAQVIEKKGNKTEAKRLYETALKMDGNLKEAKEGLERVSK